MFPGFSALPGDRLAMQQTPQPLWADRRKQFMAEQVIQQFRHRPVGERQAHIREPLSGNPQQGLQLARPDLRRSPRRIGGPLKPAKAVAIELMEPAVSSLPGTFHLPRCRQDASPLSHPGNQLITLREPYGQLPVTLLGFQHLSFASMKATQM
jgi:hypothetical protein